MKILLTEGCVVGSLLIDDVPANKLQANKLKNIVFTIINNIISNKANLIEMIDYLMTDTDLLIQKRSNLHGAHPAQIEMEEY